MARKKQKSEFPFGVVKIIGVCLLALAIGWFLCNRMVNTFMTSNYFTVKHIVTGPSLQFIHSRDLDPFKGMNIFTLNLKQVEARLERKYPQASELRVLRKFPNRLIIVAKKRMPFIQVKANNEYYIVDDKSVVLAVNKSAEKELPFVEHLSLPQSETTLGGIIKSQDVRVGINIQRSFQNYLDKSKFTIQKIELNDLSKINLILSNDLRVIVDNTNVDAKMQILSLVLTQKDFDFKDVQYIDLRFKEPILGKKK